MVIETHSYTHRRGRVGLFECECGCGQTFFADYKTRQPRYYNKAHRARAYRARARARIYADQMMMSAGSAYTTWQGQYDYALLHLLGKNRGKV